MFNALRTDELIAGMGTTMRAAAAADGPADEYARGQLLSAFSVSRLLAAEVRATPALLAWLKGELETALESSSDPAAGPARERIAAAADGNEVGDALVDLLAELRAEGRDQELRERLHAVLRELATRELAALAARPERRGQGS